MKLELERDGCIGCGVCTEVCPDVFRLAEDGLSEVIASPDGHEEAVKEAAESCPVDVIKI